MLTGAGAEAHLLNAEIELVDRHPFHYGETSSKNRPPNTNLYNDANLIKRFFPSAFTRMSLHICQKCHISFSFVV